MYICKLVLENVCQKFHEESGFSFISLLFSFSPVSSRALFLSVVLLNLVVGCAILVGLVVYATYWSCDPKAQASRLTSRVTRLPHF